MKINPNLLHNLRKKKGLTLNQLANMSKVSKRTIQRLEKSPRSSKEESSSTLHEHTLNKLAKALRVPPDVLTGKGKSPPPEFDKTDTNTKHIQIGGLIAPKVRLAYDLIKHRYSVSVTEIINMAPLFFVLLAEGSLAWRRKKVQEASELIDALEQGQAESHIFDIAVITGENAERAEKDSIDEADLFGEHLLKDSYIGEFFDPSKDNPFANYLRKLAKKFDIVDTDDNLGSFGSPWLRFPDYDICRDELDEITKSSSNARRALETGCVRLSDIPKELMEEDAGEKRAEWLERELPDIYRDLDSEEPVAKFADREATMTPPEQAKLLKKLASKETESKTKEGDSP